MDLKDFFLSESVIFDINKWIKSEYKNKALIITGANGIGKTSLANIILKDFKIINIDIHFFKNCNNLNEYLDLSLAKKDIASLFNRNKNIYKAVVFDDLNLLFDDKNLFNNIIKWYKNKDKYFKNNPTIFITNNSLLKNKSIIQLLKKNFHIKLKYNYEQFEKICFKILKNSDLKLKDYELQEFIQKSKQNINNLKSNISIFKDKYQKNVVTLTDLSKDIDDITENILTSDFCIDNLYLNKHDFNIISLNILDNINKIADKKYIKKIYNNYCLSLDYSFNIIKNNNYEIENYVFLHSIVYPVYYIKKSNNNIYNIKYNSYISKSISLISNSKNNYNYNLIIYIFMLLKKNKMIEVDNIINKYNIDKKKLVKYNKYYNYFYNFNLKLI